MNINLEDTFSYVIMGLMILICIGLVYITVYFRGLIQ